jgi:hypothetical protein
MTELEWWEGSVVSGVCLWSSETTPRRVMPREVSPIFKGTKRQADTALASLVADVEGANRPVSGSFTVAQYLDSPGWL